MGRPKSQTRAAKRSGLRAPPLGVAFDAVDVREQDTVQLTLTEAPSDEPWRHLRPGFNYVGTCKNKFCESHVNASSFDSKGEVCKNMVFGIFRPNEDYDHGNLICPSCSQRFVPSRYLFYKCGAEINYCFLNQKPTRMRFSTDDPDTCKVLGGRDIPLATYTSLIIEVSEVHARTSNWLGEGIHQVQCGGLISSCPVRHGSVLKMDPKRIRFCQDSIARWFRCGRLVEKTMLGLQRGSYQLDDIPMIHVFESGDLWYTEDNRRLWCFQEAGLPLVPVSVVSKTSVDPDKITTVNKGISVRLRH